MEPEADGALDADGHAENLEGPREQQETTRRIVRVEFQVRASPQSTSLAPASNTPSSYGLMGL
jgi:hypothetical protein